MPIQKLTIYSLFCSIGGIDLGLSPAGFKIIQANEFDKK